MQNQPGHQKASFPQGLSQALLRRLPPGQKSRIMALGESLSAAGEKINLFSKKAPIQQLNLLLEQSLISCRLLAPVFKGLPGPALDLGSGNGMPGLVCAALYPQTAFILCEKSRKKAEFLKLAVFLSKIQNASVLCQRAEDLRARFPVLLSQAAAPLKDFPPLLERLLAPGGAAFLWQASSWERSWPAGSPFSAEAFKTYRAGGSKKILLKIQKAP